jgi:hypothetical protein
VTDLDYIRNIAGRDHGPPSSPWPATTAPSLRPSSTPESWLTRSTAARWSPSSPVPHRGASNGYAPDIRLPVTFRAGWTWASVEGCAEIVGPDDPHPQLDGDALSELLRAIFTAAGGTHDDWAAYDKAMADERRPAVLIRPRRIYTNPSAPQVMTEL